MSLTIGAHLGPYEILVPLDADGMGSRQSAGESAEADRSGVNVSVD